MLKFNTILSECGVDPADVQLVRHQDIGPDGDTPYKLLLSSPLTLDDYQKVQGRKVFRKKLLAAFVAAPRNETLFVNLYRVKSVEHNKEAIHCPIRKTMYEAGRVFLYQISCDERLEDFSQRIIIRWGEGYRSWVQRADRQNKDVLEVRSRVKEELFPGYDSFMIKLCELKNAYLNWQHALSLQKGVYLLSFDDGQQYVGSATGAGGLWQRWQDYLANGHGGNVALKGRDARMAQVCILETARMSDGRQEILELEYLWHRKLGTRAVRLGDGNEIPPDA